MFPPRLLLIFAGIAATAGFGASWLVSPRLHSTIDEAAPTATRQAAPTISTRPSAYRAQTLPTDAMDLAGQALAIVRDGTKADVLRFLEAVAWGPRIPPELKSRYLEMLTRRLVELRETSELLSLGSLDIKDQERVSIFAIKAWTERAQPRRNSTFLRCLRAEIANWPCSRFSKRSAEPTPSEWAAKLSPLERMRVTPSIFEGWATRDARAAAEALQTQPPDPALDDAFPRTGRAFANIDGEAATAWAAKLPKADTQNRTISAIIDSWGSRDAAAASAYLDKLPPGDFRDHAVDGFVDSVLNLDPESAAVWAHSIQDPDRRRRKLGNTLRYWRFKDQPAAQRFVQSLPAGELREQMLEVVNE